MGLFRRKPSVDPAQLAAVTAELAAVRAQLDALGKRLEADDAARRETAATVAGLRQRVESVGAELANQLTELSGEIDALHRRPDPTAAIAAVEALGGAVEALRTQAADTSASVAEVRGEVAAVDAQVEHLQAAVDTSAADVGGLRTTQERLANEQARYQIAFREDLAALADQVARKRG